MQIESVIAIDIHAHYGEYSNGKSDINNTFQSASPEEIVGRARLANTGTTIVSPLRALMPRLKGDPVAGNEDAARVAASVDGLRQWVVVDPLKPETYEQARAMLQTPRCAGIKIHPEEHGYRIAERGREIFEFAAEMKAIVQSHSGEEKSLPEDFLPFADDFPEVTLIVSHLGCGYDGDLTHQVRAVKASRHGNVFTDTSSAKSITPGLIEWAVGEIGAERILYGSDSPCYFAPMQRARIDKAYIGDDEKRLILHDNAARLFGLP